MFYTIRIQSKNILNNILYQYKENEKFECSFEYKIVFEYKN